MSPLRSTGQRRRPEETIAVQHAYTVVGKQIFGKYGNFMDWIEDYACAPGALHSKDARVNLIIQVVPGVSSPRRKERESTLMSRNRTDYAAQPVTPKSLLKLLPTILHWTTATSLSSMFTSLLSSTLSSMRLQHGLNH